MYYLLRKLAFLHKVTTLIIYNKISPFRHLYYSMVDFVFYHDTYFSFSMYKETVNIGLFSQFLQIFMIDRIIFDV